LFILQEIKGFDKSEFYKIFSIYHQFSHEKASYNILCFFLWILTTEVSGLIMRFAISDGGQRRLSPQVKWVVFRNAI